jgi:hypothetical protein
MLSERRRSIIPVMRVDHRGSCASPDAIFGSHRYIRADAEFPDDGGLIAEGDKSYARSASEGAGAQSTIAKAIATRA